MNTIMLCLEVFFARIVDVSIGVVSTMEVVKDRTTRAAILAFFEVLIWFVVARSALTTSNMNYIIAIFYALGYACGTLFGSYLSKKLIRGSASIEVISSIIKEKEIKIIKSKGYGISSITLDNNKKMLYIQVDNRRIKELLNIIKSIDNKAFITVSDTKIVTNGYVK